MYNSMGIAAERAVIQQAFDTLRPFKAKQSAADVVAAANDATTAWRRLKGIDFTDPLAERLMLCKKYARSAASRSAWIAGIAWHSSWTS